MHTRSLGFNDSETRLNAWVMLNFAPSVSSTSSGWIAWMLVTHCLQCQRVSENYRKNSNPWFLECTLAHLVSLIRKQEWIFESCWILPRLCRPLHLFQLLECKYLIVCNAIGCKKRIERVPIPDFLNAHSLIWFRWFGNKTEFLNHVEFCPVCVVNFICLSCWNASSPLFAMPKGVRKEKKEFQSLLSLMHSRSFGFNASETRLMPWIMLNFAPSVSSTPFVWVALMHIADCLQCQRV